MQGEIPQKITLNGLSIRYKIKGKGAPVFMLHGWGGSIESWRPLMEELDDTKHCLIAVDMPGFGESDMPNTPWSVGNYAKFFGNFVQKMYTKYGLKGQYNVVVHSFGGRVIIKYASEILGASKAQSSTMGKLVLIGAAGITHPRPIRKKILQAIAQAGAALFSLPGLKLFKKKARKLMYKLLRVHDYERTSGVMRQTFINVIEEDLHLSLEYINCSTLVLWGRYDSYVPVEDAYTMGRLISNSKVRIVEDGKHGIHKTHAKKLADWIQEFFEE